MQQRSEKIAYFSARRTSISMKLIDDKVKLMICPILLQPPPCTVEYAVFDAPHEHDIQHAVVGD
jgi:hypothetical protein